MAEKTVIEQLLNTKPMQLHVWVAERKPTTAAEAGQLADDYIKVKLYCNRRVQCSGTSSGTAAADMSPRHKKGCQVLQLLADPPFT